MRFSPRGNLNNKTAWRHMADDQRVLPGFRYPRNSHDCCRRTAAPGKTALEQQRKASKPCGQGERTFLFALPSKARAVQASSLHKCVPGVPSRSVGEATSGNVS